MWGGSWHRSQTHLSVQSDRLTARVSSPFKVRYSSDVMFQDLSQNYKIRRCTVHLQKCYHILHVCVGGRMLFRNKLVTENHQLWKPRMSHTHKQWKSPRHEKQFNWSVVTDRQVDISRRRQSPRQMKIWKTNDSQILHCSLSLHVFPAFPSVQCLS